MRPPHETRALLCLRCQSPLEGLGVQRVHTGGGAFEFLSGGFASKGMQLDAWRCISCRAVEFFDASNR